MPMIVLKGGLNRLARHLVVASGLLCDHEMHSMLVVTDQRPDRHSGASESCPGWPWVIRILFGVFVYKVVLCQRSSLPTSRQTICLYNELFPTDLH